MENETTFNNFFERGLFVLSLFDGMSCGQIALKKAGIKAKGGQPRDADSRTLADHLDRYILFLKPDFVQIENVREFMAWGEIDEKGRPVHMKKGIDK